MSLIDKIEEWISSFGENLDFILISFDQAIIGSLIDALKYNSNIKRIVIPAKLSVEMANQNHGVCRFISDNQGKVIETRTFNETQGPCVIFGDFNGSNILATQLYDFNKDIERQRKYRKYCRSILMYRYSGNPPLNGYWQYESSFKLESGRVIFLNLSKWGEMVQKMPQFDIRNEELIVNITDNINVSVNWINNLKMMLTHVLPYFLGTESILDHYLSDESMIVWTRAFIHPTFNRIYGYEAIETLGDIMIKFMFCNYMVSKYPRFTHTELTEYSNEYMSKYHQYYIADDLSLTTFFLGDTNLISHSYKTKTDLMETFSGALFEISQRINACLGFVVGQNFINLIGEQFSFYKRMMFGTPKPRVNSYFASIGFKNNEDYSIKHTPEDHRVASWYLILSDKAKETIRALKAEGYDLTNLLRELKIEYRPGERYRDDVEYEFYELLDDIFTRARVDIRFSKVKRNKFISDLVGSDIYVEFVNKIRQQFPGFTEEHVISRVQFQSVQDDKSSYVMMYVATFEAAPNSLMLRSFTKFVDSQQKAGDDYIEEVDIPMQLRNLAQVPFPTEREKYGPLAEYTPYDLGCYRCIVKYIM